MNTTGALIRGARFVFRRKEICAGKVESLAYLRGGSSSMKGLLAGVAVVTVAVAVVSSSMAQSLNDGDGAYKTGHYRDLFAERGHSAAESKAKIDAAFQQMFHGDKQTQTVYFEEG